MRLTSEQLAAQLQSFQKSINDLLDAQAKQRADRSRLGMLWEQYASESPRQDETKREVPVTVSQSVSKDRLPRILRGPRASLHSVSGPQGAVWFGSGPES